MFRADHVDDVKKGGLLVLFMMKSRRQEIEILHGSGSLVMHSTVYMMRVSLADSDRVQHSPHPAGQSDAIYGSRTQKTSLVKQVPWRFSQLHVNSRLRKRFKQTAILLQA